MFWLGANARQRGLLDRQTGERRRAVGELGGWGCGQGGQLPAVVLSEKEQLQVTSRSRVKLWEWRAGREWGWSPEDEEVKELNGERSDGPHGKAGIQMPKSSMAEGE